MLEDVSSVAVIKRKMIKSTHLAEKFNLLPRVKFDWTRLRDISGISFVRLAQNGIYLLANN